MTTQVIYPATGLKGLAGFFMARLPILDRHQEMAAFELRFRDASGGDDPASIDRVLSSLLPHHVELQMERVLGDLRGFVSVDEAVLTSDEFDGASCSTFVLSIADSVKASEPLLQRVQQLAGSGFVFALEESVSNAEDAAKLIPLAEIVKFDLHKLPLESLTSLIAQPQFAHKKLLVQNVDTLAQFETCLALGFHYFQGYYFAKPVIQPDKKLAPSQLAVIEVITLISTDASDAEIEERIKSDVSLSLHLLRLVNTASVGTHRIDSLRQALMVLGRNQLLSWMQVLLYTQPRENAASIKPLLMLATVRGKLLELIAQRTRLGNRGAADTGFTVGIMSLMDTLFGIPMQEILRHLAVVDEVGEALLCQKGYYGDLLKLVEYTERADAGEPLKQALQQLHLNSDELYLLQTEAFEWSNGIARAMH
jgi:EAL and modified HD-GYP domain-containing signal transduction protein